MPDAEPRLYLHAASKRKGALGIVHIYAGEDALLGELDRHMRRGTGKAETRSGILRAGELRHGWLTGPSGEKLDEALLAKPAAGMRILMTHGGRAVRDSVDDFLRRAGFREIPRSETGVGGGAALQDDLLIPRLASAVTESQAAAILEAEGGRRGSAMSESILALHQAVLSGPPNAGKSSLLNCLAGHDRAFVHAEAGATRDVVDEVVDLGGYAVVVGDLPGFAPGGDPLDDMAWRKAAERLRRAEAILFLIDGSIAWNDAAASAAKAVRDASPPEARTLVVVNKSDLPRAIKGEPWKKHFPDARGIHVCSLPGGDARETLDAEAHLLFPPP